MVTAIVEGRQVQVGDYVGFKCDIEQYGKIISIRQATFGSGKALVVENVNGFSGEYIGGQTRTEVHASDCWLDN